jgi:hypothetical protein
MNKINKIQSRRNLGGKHIRYSIPLKLINIFYSPEDNESDVYSELDKEDIARDK